MGQAARKNVRFMDRGNMVLFEPNRAEAINFAFSAIRVFNTFAVATSSICMVQVKGVIGMACQRLFIFEVFVAHMTIEVVGTNHPMLLSGLHRGNNNSHATSGNDHTVLDSS